MRQDRARAALYIASRTILTISFRCARARARVILAPTRRIPRSVRRSREPENSTFDAAGASVTSSNRTETGRGYDEDGNDRHQNG